MNIRATARFNPVDLSRLQKRLVPRLIQATTNACAVVASKAKDIVPVDTGVLRDSIDYRVDWKGTVVSGYVFATAPYAAFIEFGTGLVGAVNPHGALPQIGVPYTGNWDYDFRRQGWIGMPAKPYLRPAIDTSHTAILDCFAAEGFTR